MPIWHTFCYLYSTPLNGSLRTLARATIPTAAVWTSPLAGWAVRSVTLSDTRSHYVCAWPARCGCHEWALCPPWVLDRVNPLYIPRNHLVEEVPSAATGGDLDPFERLLEAVAAPYDERPGLERYAAAASADFGTYRTFCGT